VYMTVCQMLAGSGGWPLTIVMTPDKKPFFAGTYFPKESHFGRIGMLELGYRIKELWKKRPEEAFSSADQIAAALQQESKDWPGGELGEPTLRAAFEQLAQRFDIRDGGFGSAPKFPTPHNFLFLLRYWKCIGHEKALEMVEKTLQAMRRGGIYDHIGFGFHRYSTDSHWLLPHFEKMLYDQALLAMAYVEAYQATGKEEYGRTAGEIFTYVLRDMTAPGGGFYSAEDADSEGEEGRFYLWAREEIEAILGREEADLVSRVFNVEKEGNFAEQSTGERTGRNILFLQKSLAEIAADLKVPVADLQKRLQDVQTKLFLARERRIHPHKDDKILTDWNGLMIAALAKGAQVLENPRYLEAAMGAADFILQNMRNAEGRLLHRYRDGQAALQAHVDDYAFLIWGLIELYEASFEVSSLKTALELNGDLLNFFWDHKNGGFYFTAEDSEKLLVRKKEAYDGAIPSGNSVAMLNLLRLGRMTANSDLEHRAAKIGSALSKNVRQSPSAYTQLLVAVDFAVGPSYEVVIAGNSRAGDTMEMLKALRRQFLPNKIVLFNPAEQASPEIFRLAEFIKTQPSLDGKATAYICMNYHCQRPTNEIDKMLELLGGK